MNAIKNYPMGSTVQEISSGLSGMIVSIVWCPDGNIRYDLAQPAKKGATAMPEGFQSDHGVVRLISPPDPAMDPKPTPPFSTTLIPLGSECENVITGARGMVTHRSLFYAGCWMYLFERLGVDKDGSHWKAEWVLPSKLKVRRATANTHGMDYPVQVIPQDPPGPPTTRSLNRKV
jgi:hypothetical protein